MTALTLERTVLPPEESLDKLVALLGPIGAEPTATVSGPNGEHMVLPPEVFAVLRDVVQAMAHGQAVTIVPVHQRLTTQEAADLLGISRPTVVKLLESGEIAFERPGHHRRVRLADVLAYRQHGAQPSVGTPSIGWSRSPTAAECTNGPQHPNEPAEQHRRRSRSSSTRACCTRPTYATRFCDSPNAVYTRRCGPLTSSPNSTGTSWR